MRMKNRPSKELVFNSLSYSMETGLFTWISSPRYGWVGKTAGAVSTSRGKSYLYVKINGKLIKAHHLAWLFEYGDWPDFDLDHMDGDSLNNRIANLRPCTMAENKANSVTYKNNVTGFKGVSRRGRKYRAYINANGKRTWLGNYDSAEAAFIAREEASIDLHGEFARSA